MEASVAISEQLRNLREVCAWANERHRTEIQVAKEASLGDPTLDYLPRHMPECAGIRVLLVPDKSRADLFIHHPLNSATSAALVFTPVH